MKIKNDNQINVEVIRFHNDDNLPDIYDEYPVDGRLYLLHTGLYSLAAFHVMRFVSFLEETSQNSLESGYFIRRSNFKTGNKRTNKDERLYVPSHTEFNASDFVCSSERNSKDIFDLSEKAVGELSKLPTTPLDENGDLTADVTVNKSRYKGVQYYKRITPTYSCHNEFGFWLDHFIVRNCVLIGHDGEILLNVAYREDSINSGSYRYPEFFKSFKGFSETILKKCFRMIYKNIKTIEDSLGASSCLLTPMDGRWAELRKYASTLTGADLADVVSVVENSVFNNQCELQKLKTKIGKDIFDKLIGRPFDLIAGNFFQAMKKDCVDFIENEIRVKTGNHKDYNHVIQILHQKIKDLFAMLDNH